MDARCAPEGIRDSHAANELRNLRVDVRSTDSAASGLPVPEGAEALSVPANDGLGANNVKRLSPPCPALRKPIQKRRSRRPSRGRLERRRSRANCCRSARFSRTRSVRAPSAARRAPSKTSTRDIAVQPRLPRDPRPACRSSSGQRQASDLPEAALRSSGLAQPRARFRDIGPP